MIRIPVTVTNETDTSHPSGGTASSTFWHLPSLVKKKQSCGSIERDLENGYGGDNASKQSTLGTAETDVGKVQIELIHVPQSVKLKSPD